MNLKFAGAGLTLLAALLAGCSNDKPAEPTAPATSPNATTATPAATNGSVKITGAGATFPNPIYSVWFDKYKATAAVDYQAIGSGKGIEQLKTGAVDFGASDAPLNDADEKAIPNTIHLPMVGGAVALGYNLPTFKGDLNLTPEIVAGIYLGKITKWNDPAIVAANKGAALPDLKITPVHRSDSSGTTYIFTNYLKAVSPEWATQRGAGKTVDWKGGIAGDKSDGVSTQVSRAPGSIGYFELTYALLKNLTFAAVKNQSGNFVKPSVDSTQAAIGDFADALIKDIKTPTVNAPGAQSYPIAGVTYILLRKSGGTAGTAAAASFWAWALKKEQQDQAKEKNYAPLPDALVKVDIDALKTIPGANLGDAK